MGRAALARVAYIKQTNEIFGVIYNLGNRKGGVSPPAIVEGGFYAQPPPTISL
ncbi:MAG: hypothetical protein LBL87_07120 [Ruminococcus sp.]|nr:hypothetical protein [Ruminococcus sp.]